MNLPQIATLKLVGLLSLYLVGCTLPPLIRPLHLYDLKDGTTIEVRLHPTSREHGMISSAESNGEQFSGEYDFASDRVPGFPPRPYGETSRMRNTDSLTPSGDFAEIYGFGKNSQARPVGTGVIVGKNGTVIDIVFYRISYDLQSGAGVARDNKGRYYRVYLSTETY